MTCFGIRLSKPNIFCPVFSAPKYCDSTENKGAYINIGPELELDFHKFEAVPHPDIKPMVGLFIPFILNLSINHGMR